MDTHTLRYWALCLLVLLCTPLQASDNQEDDVLATEEELKSLEVFVDQTIFQNRWLETPYNTRQYRYTDEQIRERWDYFNRGLRLPYPSAALMREQFARYPFMLDGIEDFNGDYEALERRLIDCMRLFLAGDFQQAREAGMKLGAIGFIPALFSQLLYAIYVTERQSEKYMLLQDVANHAQQYLELLEEAEQDPAVQHIAAAARLGYAYAIARIAEESPIPVIIFRGYIGKIKHNAERVIDVVPDHPLGHAFRGGVDAGIMRRVGKFTGRLTYNARITVVDQSFQAARALTPDIPIVAYEHGNAIFYVDRKRNIEQAIALVEEAANMRGLFSMDVLDTLYAKRRLQELKIFDAHYPSFRRFERDRRQFSRITDRNLTSLRLPPLTLEMLENPERYILPHP